MRMQLVAAAAVLVSAPLAFAQQERDPRETVKALFAGDKTVSVEYGRPGLKGRAMKDLLSQLLPDRVWRMGVDQATTLDTQIPLVIGGKAVPAGKYTLYLHAPASGDYSLIVNSDLGVPLKTIFAAAPPALADALWPRLNGYKEIEAKEVARVALKKVTPKEPIERFKVSLEPVKNGASAITLTWGGEAWTTDIKAGK
jgi:hypothetical protein